MGFLRPGKPLDSEIERRKRTASGFAAFFRKTLEEPYKAPDVTTDRGASFKPRPEMWPYPRRRDGTRREGEYLRQVSRDRHGRFAKRFDVEEFKKSHPLWYQDKTEPRR